MRDQQDLLIEIGTEELPPASLKRLALALKDGLCALLDEQTLTYSKAHWFATPRRLAVLIERLDTKQADRDQRRLGPALSAAYDQDGQPTRATTGFADSCGVSVDQLEQIETEKGTRLACHVQIKGERTPALIPALLETALKRLPVAKRMRWGAHDVEFVRPVKWVVLLFGNDIIDCNIMGVPSGRISYGHRVHHPQAITLEHVGEYENQLQRGKVIANYEERRATILSQVTALADGVNGQALADEALLDEVTALVEWPVSHIGACDPAFLELPKEILVAAMRNHQKYFPVKDRDDNLLPHFIYVANMESPQPELITQGNERVLQPRLNDAAFFWQRDLKQGLASHIPKLSKVVYQKALGTLQDKSRRIQENLLALTDHSDIDRDTAARAAELCLCDLLTDMVTEFSELQGTMGRYYAEAAGEDAAVATALEEFYRPRFAGDRLPETRLGQYLALSDKLDALVGIFAIGKAPTGDKDPFGLRRVAIGTLRILIECDLDLDLKALITQSAQNYPAEVKATDCIADVYRFMQERLRGYYTDNGIATDVFESVLVVNPTRPVDFDRRLRAVDKFRQLEAAQSLAAANKRIGNILKKSNTAVNGEIDPALLNEPSEITLAQSLEQYRERLVPLLDNRDYTEALKALAGLREDVDAFFDNVMVMCDDAEQMKNRLTLLHKLSTLFLQIADISRLRV